MNYQELNVPVQYRYLSDWQDLLNILPHHGKYIMNKVNTGCGGTTLFLGSPRPCIMVSPRNNVLYSKSAQFPNAHLFRRKTDTSTPVKILKERLRDYINLCASHQFPGMQRNAAPKILVTIDSYPYVAEQLEYMGILDQFDVLVDEFHCLMSDSKFKGRTELEFLHNLRGMKSVCYMSATPIEETSLDLFPDFEDVDTYCRLVWDPSALEMPNLDMKPYRPRQNAKSICREIIDGYRKNGYFAVKYTGGAPVYSRECVFFLNDLRTIVQIIEENSLNPDDVNVLCSPSNRHVNDLKNLNVHIGELATDPFNPVNRTFTFVTRASFEGVDFYSSSAFAYIFSDGILDWTRNDLIIDTPQILGRQRLDQPFRKDAVLYYRPDYRADNVTAIERIKEKERITREWIEQFNASPEAVKMMLKDGIDKRSDDKRYADDYVEFVDDMNGGFVPKENYLVKSTELRDWQLSSYVYSSPIQIVRTVVDGMNINVTSTCGFSTQSGTHAIDQFNRKFFRATPFPDKMRIYSEMRSLHPECTETLYQNTFIDYHLHLYYDTLGPDRIEALRYREKDIADAVSNVMLTQRVVEECRKVFIPSECYFLKEVKSIMQDIYRTVGINATAKAKDIVNFVPSAKLRQLTNTSTGKRELCYEIQ